MQIRQIMLALVGVSALGGAALASNDDASSGNGPGLSEAQVETILRDAGYTLTEFEVEDGEVEAEGDRDGISWELVIDARTGAILSVEQDD